MLDRQLLKDYYEKNWGKVDLPDKPNFRQWKFMLSDGTMLKIKDTIRTKEDVYKWIKKLGYGVQHIYHSAGTFLDSAKIKERGKKVSENMFLDLTLIVDIDKSPMCLENLEKSRKETIKVIKFMESKGFKLKLIAFSGSKGFKLKFKDKPHMTHINPIDREDYHAMIRKYLIVEEIKKKGLNIDFNTTLNTRLVHRCLGTINGKSGYSCTRISYQQLCKPIKKLLSYVPHCKGSPMMPAKADDKQNEVSNNGTPATVHQEGGRNGLILPFKFFYNLTSGVLGAKENILILKYPVKMNLHKLINELKFLIGKYKLTDFYLFKTSREYYAVSIKLMDSIRIRKIMNRSSSINRAEFKKYGFCYMRISEIRRGDIKDKVTAKDIEEDKPEFICLVESKFNGINVVSKGHYNLFRSFSYDYPFKHGSEGYIRYFTAYDTRRGALEW